MAPKIVVLDALPLNPGDLDWRPLRALGKLTIHDGTNAAEVAARLARAEVVFTNKVRIDAAALAAAPRLRFIGVLATGYDVVDVAEAGRRGIVVCNVPSYSAAFTAQTTIALLLEFTHHAGAHDAAVHAGQWSRGGSFSFWNYPLLELEGKTLLVVGMGNIGSRVARIATALGMNVQAALLPGREGKIKAGEYAYHPLVDALNGADVVSLHCPLTPETRHLMNAERVGWLKTGALLLNTARGQLVDEDAVAECLEAGFLGGYGCDVLSREPPPSDHPLLHVPGCIITPHLGWASLEARRRLLTVSVDNLRCFLQGNVQNQVSGS